MPFDEEPAEEPTKEPVEEPAEEPVEKPGEEEESGGGICPGAAVALPLATMSVLVISRRRR